jgi:hypothetical protein
MGNLIQIYFLRSKCMLLLCMIITVIGIPWPLSASINGSPHDMSTKQCYFCHASKTEPGQVPLWDDFPQPRTYATYVSQTHDIKNSQEIQPESFLCLGCHNGIFSRYVSNLGPSATSDMTSEEAPDFPNGGISPANTHPVCFTYDPGRDADGNNFPPAAPVPGDSGTIAIRGGKTGTLYPLYGLKKDQFECTTCHIAHYDDNGHSSGKYHVYMLRTDNSRSIMCRDCHQNKY